MPYSTINVVTDARGIATLTLARPEKHNAMNHEMMIEITDAAKALGADETVRAVVLAALGKSFCAGGDLNWMRAQAEQDRAGKIAEARVLANMLATLNALPKPLIGRVEGNAFGGGIGMMAVCDIFDALTATDRPYKASVPLDRALSILQSEVVSGHIDADLVQLFSQAKIYNILDIK